MKLEQYTYWSVTINNPDENDYLIIRNPNEKYIRSLVWTAEEGAKERTPHIQAWVRLQRNQAKHFMSKIYPRGHFKYITKDDYNEATHRYAQKNDETTMGLHHITLNDPLPANDTLLYQVLERSFEELLQRDENFKDIFDHDYDDDKKQMIVFDEYGLTLKRLNTSFMERSMVRERAGLEKIFVSPVYEKMKTRYWRDILYRIIHKQHADRIQTEDTGGGRSDSGSSASGQSHEDGETSQTSRSDEGGRSTTGSWDDQ